jgi:hypothetical protein
VPFALEAETQSSPLYPKHVTQIAQPNRRLSVWFVLDGFTNKELQSRLLHFGVPVCYLLPKTSLV